MSKAKDKTEPLILSSKKKLKDSSESYGFFGNTGVSIGMDIVI